MAALKDLTGKTFGRLTVVSLLPERTKSGNTKWRCRCSCGGWATSVIGSSLINGNSTSCGCYKLSSSSERMMGNTIGVIHGKSNTSNYHRWENIKARTSKESCPVFEHYGGRGIKMHEPWFESFILFDSWLNENLGPCPEGHSIDRIDVNGNYEPNNLRWASAKTQSSNRRCCYGV